MRRQPKCCNKSTRARRILKRSKPKFANGKRKRAKTAEAELRSRAAQIANELAAIACWTKISASPKCRMRMENCCKAVADALKTKFNGPIFLVGARDASVALVASVPKQLTSKFQANKLIQQIAPIVGGKGGGRPESAQGAQAEGARQDRGGGCESAGASEIF